MNLSRAMEVSCNAYFAKLSQEMGWKELKEQLKHLFYGILFFGYQDNKSRLPVSRQTDAEELAWSGVGQGKILVSPLIWL